MSNQGMGVDDFLNSGSDHIFGGGNFLAWKKDGEGSAQVLLHTKTWCARSWNHPIPEVIEFEDKKTKDQVVKVTSRRWGCHETHELNLHRYNRTSEDRREMPPVICPSCIFPEVLRELVAEGKIKWTDRLFVWPADEEHEVLAGGVYNAFGQKHVERDRELLKELKKAGVDRRETWNQSQLVRMQWLFILVNLAELDKGLTKTFESKALGDKMKTAIKAEMQKHRKAGKDPALGDPTQNPYPFEWTFDNGKLFDDKFEVLALTENQVSAEALAIIRGPAPKIDDDLAPGNCWWLRNELEAHYVHDYKFPWDRVFEAADKAGLMVPPSDSKADASEDEDDDVPEVGRSDAESYAIGPEHDVWFEDAKIDPEVKNKRVLVTCSEEEPPTEADLEAVKKILIGWGAAVVAVMVECDHCAELMPSDEIDCPKCGSQYDETGKLIGRRCLANKKHVVDVTTAEGPRHICGDCATIHELLPETPDCVGLQRWQRVETPKAAEEPAKAAETGKRRRVSGETKPAEEPKPEELKKRTRVGGVPFDRASK